MATPFNAIGAGNGFPWCITSGSPGSVASQLILQGMTLSEAMHLYWNVRTLRLAFSATINWEEGVKDSQDNYSYSLHSYTWSLDETWDSVHEDINGTTPLPEGNDRVCPGLYRLGPEQRVLRDSGRIELRGDLRELRNTTNGVNQSFYKNNGEYDYWLDNGRSVVLRNPVDPEENSRRVGIIRFFGLNVSPTPDMPEIRETRSFSHYLGTTQDVRLETIPTLTKPFEGLSYIDHTFSQFEWDLGFHTY